MNETLSRADMARGSCLNAISLSCPAFLHPPEIIKTFIGLREFARSTRNNVHDERWTPRRSPAGISAAPFVRAIRRRSNQPANRKRCPGYAPELHFRPRECPL